MAYHDEEIYLNVMRAYQTGNFTQGEIARHYGVPRQTVRNWIAGKHRPKQKDAKENLWNEFHGVANAAPSFVAEPPQAYGASAMFIGDLHAPFMHQDAFEFCKEAHKKYKPQHVILSGDEIDSHALGRFPKDPDGMGAGKELEKAIEQLIPFYRYFRNVRVCESNHTVRAYKRAFDAAIPSAFLRAIETVLNAPDDWKWAEHWIVDDVLYIHGDPYHGRNAVIKHMHETFMSVGIGHTHSYGRAEHFVTRFRKFFALDAGCLIDNSAYAFKYASKMNRKPTLGLGIVHNREHAEFIPLLTDEHGRWTGKFQ